MDNNTVIDLSKGFDISFLTEEEEEVKYQIERDALNTEKKKLELIYDRINEFLQKLKSNPKAVTIKWPDRISDIEKFENQIDEIYKG